MNEQKNFIKKIMLQEKKTARWIDFGFFTKVSLNMNAYRWSERRLKKKKIFHRAIKCSTGFWFRFCALTWIVAYCLHNFCEGQVFLRTLKLHFYFTNQIDLGNKHKIGSNTNWNRKRIQLFQIIKMSTSFWCKIFANWNRNLRTTK